MPKHESKVIKWVLTMASSHCWEGLPLCSLLGSPAKQIPTHIGKADHCLHYFTDTWQLSHNISNSSSQLNRTLVLKFHNLIPGKTPAFLGGNVTYRSFTLWYHKHAKWFLRAGDDGSINRREKQTRREIPKRCTASQTHDPLEICRAPLCRVGVTPTLEKTTRELQKPSIFLSKILATWHSRHSPKGTNHWQTQQAHRNPTAIDHPGTPCNLWIIWEFLRNAILGPIPALLYQDLHFNKIPGY